MRPPSASPARTALPAAHFERNDVIIIRETVHWNALTARKRKGEPLRPAFRHQDYIAEQFNTQIKGIVSKQKNGMKLPTDGWLFSQSL
jgi:hypothetical protein